MWYLKVSPNLFIAVALICMIQNAISFAINPNATEDKWDTLAESTTHKDLKKLSVNCKKTINNFNEKVENMKTSTNKKLFEPNKTTADIVNLASDVKSQLKNASNSIVSLRKIVQKMALRFRDYFKSLESFTELDHNLINEELKVIEKTTVDNKKPSVKNAIKSFGNRYDLNKLAIKVLKTTSNNEKLKDNYNDKQKFAKQEFSLLWNTLKRHAKNVNNDALETMKIFIDGVDSVKYVKKKAKNDEEDALNEKNGGGHINKLKNAVELAKALNLKFEDDFELESGEMTYSQEGKKEFKNELNEKQPDNTLNSEEQMLDDNLTNNLQPDTQEIKDKIVTNIEMDTTQPKSQEKLQDPILNNTNFKNLDTPNDKKLPNVEDKNNDEVNTTQPKSLNQRQDPSENNTNSNNESNPMEQKTHNDEDKERDKENITRPKSQEAEQTSINKNSKPNAVNSPITKIDQKQQTAPTKNPRGKRKIMATKREKIPLLPWKELIKQIDPQISNQSKTCRNRIQNTLKELDTMKTPVRNAIQNVKNYRELEKIKNDTVEQFHDKMIDTNKLLADSLVKAAEDVCAKVMPLNKRYETKFKNDSYIKQIEYFLSKKYDPNQYILNILTSTKNTNEEQQKVSYNNMLSLAYNLKNETKDMENAALYAMNKINEGKFAAKDLNKMFNKEKASKACYIKNLLLERENEQDIKRKDENKKKVKDNMKETTEVKPLNPNINLDSIEKVDQYPIEDHDEPKIIDDDEQRHLNDKNKNENASETELIKELNPSENVTKFDKDIPNNIVENFRDAFVPENKKTEKKNVESNNQDQNNDQNRRDKKTEEVLYENAKSSELSKNTDVIPESEPQNQNDITAQRDITEADDFGMKNDEIQKQKVSDSYPSSREQKPNLSTKPISKNKTQMKKIPVKRRRKVKKPVEKEDVLEEYEEMEDVPNDDSNVSGLVKESDEDPKSEHASINDRNVPRSIPKAENTGIKTDKNPKSATENPNDSIELSDIPNTEESVKEEDDTETTNLSKSNPSSENAEPNLSTKPISKEKRPMKKPVKRRRKVKKPLEGDDDIEEYEEMEEVPDDGSDDSEFEKNSDKEPKSEPENKKDSDIQRGIPQAEKSGEVPDKKPNSEPENPNEKSVSSKKPKTEESNKLADETKQPNLPASNPSTENSEPILSTEPISSNKVPLKKRPVKRRRKVKKPLETEDISEEYVEMEEVPDDDSNDSEIERDSNTVPKSEPENINDSNVKRDIPQAQISGEVPDLQPKSEPENVTEKSVSSEIPKTEKSDKVAYETKQPNVPVSNASSENIEPILSPQQNSSEKAPMKKRPVKRRRKVKKPSEGDDDIEEYEEMEEVPDDGTDDSELEKDSDTEPKSEPENKNDRNVIRGIPQAAISGEVPDLKPKSEPENVTEKSVSSEIPKTDEPTIVANESKQPNQLESNPSSENLEPISSTKPISRNKAPLKKRPVKRRRKVKKPLESEYISEEYVEMEEVPDDGSVDSGKEEDSDTEPKSEPDNTNDINFKRSIPQVEISGEVPDKKLNSEPENPNEKSVSSETPKTEESNKVADETKQPNVPASNASSENLEPILSPLPISSEKTPMKKRPVKRRRKVKKPSEGDGDIEEYEEMEEVPDDGTDDSELEKDSDTEPKSEPENKNDRNVIRGIPQAAISGEVPDLKPKSEPENVTEKSVASETPKTDEPTIVANESKQPNVPASNASSENLEPILSPQPISSEKTPMKKRPVKRRRKVKKPSEGDGDIEEYEEMEEVPDDGTDDSELEKDSDTEPKSEPENKNDRNVIRGIPQAAISGEVPDLKPKSEPENVTEKSVASETPKTDEPTIVANESKQPNRLESNPSSENLEPISTTKPISRNKAPLKKRPVKRRRKIKKPLESEYISEEYVEMEEVPDDGSVDSGIEEDSDTEPKSEPDNTNDINFKRSIPQVEISGEVPDKKPNSEPENPNEKSVSSETPKTEETNKVADETKQPNVPASNAFSENLEPILSPLPISSEKTPMKKRPVKRRRKVKKPSEGDDDIEEYEEMEEVPDDGTDDSELEKDSDTEPKSEPENPNDSNFKRSIPHVELSGEVPDLKPKSEPENPNEKSVASETPKTDEPTIVANESKQPNRLESNPSSENLELILSTEPISKNKAPLKKRPVKRRRMVKKPLESEYISEEYVEMEEVPDDGSVDSGIEEDSDTEPKSEPDNTNDINFKRSRPHAELSGEVPDLKPNSEPENPNEKSVSSETPKTEESNKVADETKQPNVPAINASSENLEPILSPQPISSEKTPMKKRPVKRRRKVNNPSEGDDDIEEYEEMEEIPEDGTDDSELEKDSDTEPKSEPENTNDSNFKRSIPHVKLSGEVPDLKPNSEPENPNEKSVASETPKTDEPTIVADETKQPNVPASNPSFEILEPILSTEPISKNKAPLKKRPVKRRRKVKKPLESEYISEEYVEMEEVPDDGSVDSGIEEDSDTEPKSEPENINDSNFKRSIPQVKISGEVPDLQPKSEPENVTEKSVSSETSKTDEPTIVANESKQPNRLESNPSSEILEPILSTEPISKNKAPLKKRPVKRRRKVKKPLESEYISEEYVEMEEVPDDGSVDSGIEEDSDIEPKSEPENINDSNFKRSIPQVKISGEVPDLQPKSEPENVTEKSVSSEIPKTEESNKVADETKQTNVPASHPSSENLEAFLSSEPISNEKAPMKKRPVKRRRKVKNPSEDDDDIEDYEEMDDVPDDGSDDSGLREESDNEPKSLTENLSDSNEPRDKPVFDDLDKESDGLEKPNLTENNTSSENSELSTSFEPISIDNEPLKEIPVKRRKIVKKPIEAEDVSEEYEETVEISEDDSGDSALEKESDNEPISELENINDTYIPRDIPQAENSVIEIGKKPKSATENSNEKNVPSDIPNTNKSSKEVDYTESPLLSESIPPSEDSEPIPSSEHISKDKAPMQRKPVKRLRKVKKPLEDDDGIEKYDEMEEVPDDGSDDSGLENESDTVPKSEPENPNEKSVSSEIPKTEESNEVADETKRTNVPASHPSSENLEPILSSEPIFSEKEPMKKKPVKRRRKVNKTLEGDDDIDEYEEMEEVPEDVSNDSELEKDSNTVPKSEPENINDSKVKRDIPQAEISGEVPDLKPKSEPENDTEKSVSSEKPKTEESNKVADKTKQPNVPASNPSSENSEPIISLEPISSEKAPMNKKPVKRRRKVKKPLESDDDIEENEEMEEVPDDGSDDSEFENDSDTDPKREPENPNENNVSSDIPKIEKSSKEVDDTEKPNLSESYPSFENSEPILSSEPTSNEKAPMKKNPVKRVRKVKKSAEVVNLEKEYEETKEVFDDESDKSELSNKFISEPNSEEKSFTKDDSDDEIKPFAEISDEFEETKEIYDGDGLLESEALDRNDIPKESNLPDHDVSKITLPSGEDLEQKNVANNGEVVPDSVSEIEDAHSNAINSPVSDDYRRKKKKVRRHRKLPSPELSDNLAINNEKTVEDSGIESHSTEEPNELNSYPISEDPNSNFTIDQISNDNTPKKNKPAKLVKKLKNPEEGDDFKGEYEGNDNIPDDESYDSGLSNASNGVPSAVDNSYKNNNEDNDMEPFAEISEEYEETKEADDGDVHPESDIPDHSDIAEGKNMPEYNLSNSSLPSGEDLEQNGNVENGEYAPDSSPENEDNHHNYSPKNKKKRRSLRKRPDSKLGDHLTNDYETLDQTENNPNSELRNRVNSAEVSLGDAYIDENNIPDKSFSQNIENNPRAADNVIHDDPEISQDIFEEYEETKEVDDTEPTDYDGAEENSNYMDPSESLNNENSNPEEEKSEYPETSDLSPEDSIHPQDIDRQEKPFDPPRRKLRRVPRLSKKPKNTSKQSNEPELDDNIDDFSSDIKDKNDDTISIDDQEKLQEKDIEPLESPEINKMEYDRAPDSLDDSESPSEVEPSLNNEDEKGDEDSGKKEDLKEKKGKKNKKKKLIRRRKSTTSNNTLKKKIITEENTSETLRKKKEKTNNDKYSSENLEEEKSTDIKPKKKKKIRVKRLKRYLVNKATNERIPIDDDMNMNTDQTPESSENPESFDAENQPEDSNLDDSNMEEDNTSYSAFLFSENNLDQCKRDAYDRFKKVISEDSKDIVYQCVLHASEMRSYVLVTIKNAIKNVKIAKTSRDVDESLRTVSDVLKSGLKRTIKLIKESMTKVLPLTKNFLETTKNLRELYEKGPQSTHRMLTNVLKSEQSIPDLDEGLLKLISPKFNVDELIDGIFEKSLNAKSLKNKKANVQRKFIELSKNMDTAVSNIDCYVLSTMSTIGIGSNALKSLKSGRMIMSEKHPRTKALKDALGIVKSLQKILKDVESTPTSNTDNTIEVNNDDDDDDDDEDPEQVAKKNDEFLKTVPNLDDNVRGTLSSNKKVPNKRRSFGVIVVHPNKEVEYKEVTDTSELKKFVGDRTNKYVKQSQNNRPKFLKVNSKKLVEKMVADVKKKADKNGMSKKEMVDEIIDTLKKNKS